MSLAFHREDPLPFTLLITTSIQHVLSLAAFLVFPILVGRAAGVSEMDLPGVLGATLVTMGLANLLQASRVTGSGYLCPAGMTSTHLGPSLVAAKLGGLSLVFGMTLFAGASEAVLSRLLTRLKVLFPPEITGVVILLVGLSNATNGLKTIFPANGSAHSSDVAVAGVTCTVMIVTSMFGSGRLRLFCALIGILVGYSASMILGVLKLSDFAYFVDLPPFTIPRFSLDGWSFSPALALPFLVVAFAATAKQAGFVAYAAQLEGGSPEHDLARATRRGVMADALGTMVGGVVGGLGVNVSASSSGLITATHISTRRVGYGIAIMLLALGFQPHFVAFLAIMPRRHHCCCPRLHLDFCFIEWHGNGHKVRTRSREDDLRRAGYTGWSCSRQRSGHRRLGSPFLDAVPLLVVSRRGQQSLSSSTPFLSCIGPWPRHPANGFHSARPVNDE